MQAHSKFLMQVYDAVNRHFNFDELKVLIIASPGFTKETVYSFLLEEAVVRSLPYLGRSVLWKDPDRVPVGGVQRQNNKALTQAKSKFLLLHSPSHHVHSLAQILSSPEVRLHIAIAREREANAHSRACPRCALNRCQHNSRTPNSRKRASCSKSAQSFPA